MHTPMTAALDRYCTDLAEGDRIKTLVTFLVLIAFYTLTATSNFSETDDVFAFAYRAENFSLDTISDPRLMLYHMAMRLLYLGASSINESIQALTLMRGFSIICAAATILIFFRLLVREFSLSPVSAAITGGALACCYGFWRYAAEAEVYIAAMLLLLLVLSLLLRCSRSDDLALGRTLAAALLAAVSVLFYQASVLAAFFAFPFLLFLPFKRQRKGRYKRLAQLVIYMGVGGTLVVGGYLLGFLFARDALFPPQALFPQETLSQPALFSRETLEQMRQFLAQRSQEFMVPTLTVAVFIKSIIKSGFALSHDLVSANWVFAIDSVTQLVQRVFPSNVVEEEIFAAKSAGAFVFLPLLLLPALGLVLVKLVWRLPNIPWRQYQAHGTAACILWLVISAMVIGRLNPAGIEAWLMVLPPLMLLIGVFIIEPAWQAGRGRWLGAALVLLLAHNVAGGMAMMWNQDGDYDYLYGRWAIENSNTNDLIIVVDDAGFAEQMRYLSPASVSLIRATSSPDVARMLLLGKQEARPVFTFGRDFNNQLLYQHLQKVREEKGRVIVFENFFTWNTEFRRYYGTPSPEQAHDLNALQRQMQRIDYDGNGLGDKGEPTSLASGIGATFTLSIPTISPPTVSSPTFSPPIFSPRPSQ